MALILASNQLDYICTANNMKKTPKIIIPHFYKLYKQIILTNINFIYFHIDLPLKIVSINVDRTFLRYNSTVDLA